MKRNLYDLTDEPFAIFVNTIGGILRDESINHNIVGGAATQVYILDMLTKKYKTNVLGLLKDDEIRLQDYIRATDDVDLALGLEGEDTEKIKRINRDILPKLIFEEISPTGENIIEFREERIGVSRPQFRVYVDGIGSQEDIIAVNISRAQDGDLHKLDNLWYNEFLKQSRDFNIPFCKDYNLKINVPKLEHLLASKIAQSRAKDLMDNKNLTRLIRESNIKLDFDEMHKILIPYHEDNYKRFLDHLDCNLNLKKIECKV